MQAMFTFFALGLAVGWVACRVVDEHSLKQHRELFPDGIPELKPAAAPAVEEAPAEAAT